MWTETIEVTDSSIIWFFVSLTGSINSFLNPLKAIYFRFEFNSLFNNEVLRVWLGRPRYCSLPISMLDAIFSCKQWRHVTSPTNERLSILPSTFTLNFGGVAAKIIFKWLNPKSHFEADKIEILVDKCSKTQLHEINCFPATSKLGISCSLNPCRQKNVYEYDLSTKWTPSSRRGAKR